VPDKNIVEAFHVSMSDDFNSVAALGGINIAFKQGLEAITGKKDPQKQAQVAGVACAIRETGRVLGLFKEPAISQIENLKGKLLPILGVTAEEITAAIQERKDARASKDFARGDAVRDAMAGRGIEFRDTPQGTVWSIKFND